MKVICDEHNVEMVDDPPLALYECPVDGCSKVIDHESLAYLGKTALEREIRVI